MCKSSEPENNKIGIFYKYNGSTYMNGEFAAAFALILFFVIGILLCYCYHN